MALQSPSGPFGSLDVEDAGAIPAITEPAEPGAVSRAPGRPVWAGSRW